MITPREDDLSAVLQVEPMYYYFCTIYHFPVYITSGVVVTVLAKSCDVYNIIINHIVSLEFH